jgi:hypothetical protein
LVYAIMLVKGLGERVLSYGLWVAGWQFRVLFFKFTYNPPTTNIDFLILLLLF